MCVCVCVCVHFHTCVVVPIPNVVAERASKYQGTPEKASCVVGSVKHHHEWTAFFGRLPSYNTMQQIFLDFIAMLIPIRGHLPWCFCLVCIRLHFHAFFCHCHGSMQVPLNLPLHIMTCFAIIIMHGTGLNWVVLFLKSPFYGHKNSKSRAMLTTSREAFFLYAREGHFFYFFIIALSSCSTCRLSTLCTGSQPCLCSGIS